MRVSVVVLCKDAGGGEDEGEEETAPSRRVSRPLQWNRTTASGTAVIFSCEWAKGVSPGVSSADGGGGGR